jgi:Subtilase family
MSHGTLVSNVAAGDTYGYAPKASMWVYCPPKKDISVNFILAAFDEIAGHSRQGYAVLNCSWGFENEVSSGHILNDALQAVIDTNVIVVVAAGNKSVSYCNVEELFVILIILL